MEWNVGWNMEWTMEHTWFTTNMLIMWPCPLIIHLRTRTKGEMIVTIIHVCVHISPPL